MSKSERKAMIGPREDLSLSRQCQLVQISRSTLYYQRPLRNGRIPCCAWVGYSFLKLEISAWGDHLADGADLLLWGCEIGDGGDGNACIDPVKSCSCYKEENAAMSGPLEDGIKRWTAKRKSALVIEIIQGKTTVAEASRSFDLAPFLRSRTGWMTRVRAWKTP